MAGPTINSAFASAVAHANFSAVAFHVRRRAGPVPLGVCMARFSFACIALCPVFCAAGTVTALGAGIVTSSTLVLIEDDGAEEGACVVRVSVMPVLHRPALPVHACGNRASGALRPMVLTAEAGAGTNVSERAVQLHRLVDRLRFREGAS